MEVIHRRIIRYGELPDYAGALALALSYAARYSETGQLAEVQEICEWAIGLPGSDTDHLHLVANLARITSQAQTATTEQRALMSRAIQAALGRSWPSVLWNLVSALQKGPEPDWWFDLLKLIRHEELGVDTSDIQPVLVVRRTLFTLQSMVERIEHSAGEANDETLFQLQDLIRRLRDDAIPNWLSMDPGPPHSNLAYQEIDEMLEEIGRFLPEANQALNRVLAQPRAQARRVLEDWERSDFPAVSAGLRCLLLWDPDRKRVLLAEQALKNTPAWLKKVQRGPRSGEHYQAFIMDIEYEGRELRNQMGPASWLDLILEGCRQLSRGAWPADLFVDMPRLVKEMPWLRRFERSERLPAEAQQNAPGGENGSHPNGAGCFTSLNGTARGKLGFDLDLQLTAPLDNWVAEARGSSARVFTGQLRDALTHPVQAAIKLMRMDKIDYSLPLFREEVLVLNAMRGVPGITPLFECGFLKFDEGSTLPTERETSINPALTGSLLRIGPNIGQEFVQPAGSADQRRLDALPGDRAARPARKPAGFVRCQYDRWDLPARG